MNLHYDETSLQCSKERWTQNPHLGACTNGDFYMALGSSKGLALWVSVGGGLLKRVLYFFGNEPSLGRKTLILQLPQNP